MASRSSAPHPRKKPEARIIILLRDPVERAFSHYLMDALDGRPFKSFYDLIIEQYQRGAKVFGTGHLYVELGLYHEQVKRYREVLGEQVLVLMFEDLVQRPLETIVRAAEFLDLAQEPARNTPAIGTVYMPYLVPRNRSVQFMMRFRKLRMLWRHVVPVNIRRFVRYTILTERGSKPLIDPRAVAFLQSIYGPDLQSLEGLLGQPLPALRKTWV